MHRPGPEGNLGPAPARRRRRAGGVGLGVAAFALVAVAAEWIRGPGAWLTVGAAAGFAALGLLQARHGT